MPIEGFDYQNFAQILTSQAGELLPADFSEFNKNYVINTIQNFASLAGEALYNDTSLHYNAEQAMLITQIIAEWSFHKSVDLTRSGILPDYWDTVMQKIAFTIFEIAKQGISQNLPQDQLLQIVEHHVKKAYEEALEELKKNNIIDEDTLKVAESQSNIDAMMSQIQHDKEEQERLASSTPPDDSKILKLASVALLLKQVSQDKVQAILNKFDPSDAQTVIQYMQMQDLELKIDKNIAMKCLQEIKTNLPEPKVINPNKILSKMKKVFNEKGKTKIEIAIRNERANVKDFVKMASDGEFKPMPTRIANIIAQHLEESI